MFCYLVIFATCSFDLYNIETTPQLYMIQIYLHEYVDMKWVSSVDIASTFLSHMTVSSCDTVS